jgi:hypothetical protein
LNRFKRAPGRVEVADLLDFYGPPIEEEKRTAIRPSVSSVSHKVANVSFMIGLQQSQTRRLLEDGIGIIDKLLTSDEPVTFKNERWDLREARLHLRPYSNGKTGDRANGDGGDGDVEQRKCSNLLEVAEPVLDAVLHGALASAVSTSQCSASASKPAALEKPVSSDACCPQAKPICRPPLQYGIRASNNDAGRRP